MKESDKMYAEGRSDFMLIQFRFKNHGCFYEENFLDLLATREERHIDTTIDINGNKLLPIIEINGANASGKSTILEALNFMFEMIKNSSNIDITKDLPTKPFLFSEKTRKEDSEYEISICLGDYEYRYGFTINKDGFNEEWLYKKRFALNTRASQQTIFERCGNNIEFGKSYSKYENTWNLFKNETSSNKLLILTNLARKEEKGVLRDIYNFVCKCNVNIESVLNRDVSIEILNKDNKLFDSFKKIINELDPCLKGIKIKKIENEENKYTVNGIHYDIENKNKVLIPIDYESDGTIKIFEIMPKILKNLEIGGLLCIDELDIKFHPLLFRKIVNMYKDKEINKNNAQLIYTAHSTIMLNSDDLRRDQLYLVEKNNLGQSNLYSLSEFKNLRGDANYEKKYLSGQFGAIPYENE